jgi:hypothetical protein
MSRPGPPTSFVHGRVAMLRAFRIPGDAWRGRLLRGIVGNVELLLDRKRAVDEYATCVVAVR